MATVQAFKNLVFMGTLGVVAAGQLSGCKACTGDPTTEADAKADKAAKAERAKPKPKRRPGGEAKAKWRASHPMLVEGIVDAERPLGEPVVAARALILEGDAGKAAEARELLAGWIPEHAEDADAVYWRGRSWAVESIREQSQPDFEAALALDDTLVGAHRWLAYERYLAEECAMAMPHLDKVVELAPTLGEGWYNRGLCTADVSGRKAGLPDFQKACELELVVACELVEALGKKADRSKIRAGRGAGEFGVRGKGGKGGKGGKLGKGAKSKLGGRFRGRGKGKGKVGPAKAAPAEDAPAEDAPAEGSPTP